MNVAMAAEIKTDWLTSETRSECAVISLTHVTREYAGHAGAVLALDDATFTIVSGEWVALAGVSTVLIAHTWYLRGRSRRGYAIWRTAARR